eukprot:602102-Pleurochrysis_carterae.AAC.1
MDLTTAILNGDLRAPLSALCIRMHPPRHSHFSTWPTHVDPIQSRHSLAGRYKADVTAALTKDLGEGVTMTADLTIDGLIPFQFSCKVCGANCTITVPIIKEKVSIPAPPCPIKARTLKQSMSFSLPTAPPIKMQAGFDGTVLLADASGAQLLKMSVKAETAPGQAAMQMLASEAT